MNPTTITLEALEALAAAAESDNAVEHARLARLCTAYGRILRARDPEKFQHKACHVGDEAGHCDSSYPPDQKYTECTGPRALRLRMRATEDIATSGGFYYSWRRVTTDGGLYLGLDGSWYRSSETGTGEVGSFAAHPGDCNVDCTIEWSTVDVDELTLEELRAAEATLRELAFPLVAEKLAS